MDYIIHLSAMGSTLSVTLSDCFMNKMEKDSLSPSNRSSIVDMPTTNITEKTKINLMSYYKG